MAWRVWPSLRNSWPFVPSQHTNSFTNAKARLAFLFLKTVADPKNNLRLHCEEEIVPVSLISTWASLFQVLSLYTRSERTQDITATVIGKDYRGLCHVSCSTLIFCPSWSAFRVHFLALKSGTGQTCVYPIKFCCFVFSSVTGVYSEARKERAYKVRPKKSVKFIENKGRRSSTLYERKIYFSLMVSSFILCMAQKC